MGMSLPISNNESVIHYTTNTCFTATVTIEVFKESLIGTELFVEQGIPIRDAPGARVDVVLQDVIDLTQLFEMIPVANVS